METFNNNGIDYNIDLSTKTIEWKEKGMNYTIKLFSFTQNEDIGRAIALYRGEMTNKDLLVTSGLTEIEAEAQIYKQNTHKGEVYFPVHDFSQASMTVEHLKLFINMVTGKYFNFEPYPLV